MLTEILRRYQRFNPATGTFDAERSLRAYAQLLGVNVATLSLLFNGLRAEPSRATLQALARTFPAAAPEIAAALQAQPEPIPA
jgi:transcriptional regulator with XRE-family HTH domain